MQDERRINKNIKANPEIENFARIVLNEEGFLLANNIFNDLFSIDEQIKQKAINYLLSLVPSKPKRPFFYVQNDLKLGKNMWTRVVVTYLGAYLNVILDFVYKEIGGFKKYLPFGQVLSKLKGKISNDLYKNINQYNQVFYRKAKHDFDEANYDGNDHLFSVKDVIYCCFVTMKLSEELKKYLKAPVDFSEVDMV